MPADALAAPNIIRQDSVMLRVELVYFAAVAHLAAARFARHRTVRRVL